MPDQPHIQRGFTLIELMVAIAVLSILMVMAIPSFNDFRQRAALRGASDQIVSFWGDARFAALRQNQLVRVSFVASGDNMCIGATTAANHCNCLTNAAVCDIGYYPSDQADWRRVRIDSEFVTTLGNSTGEVVIDPKRGNITNSTHAGKIFLRSPPGGSTDYRLNVDIDRNGRAVLCEPIAAPSKLPQYSDRRC